MLENPGWGSVLEQSAKEVPEMARSLGAGRVLIARDMRYKGTTVKHGDVVFMDPAKTYSIVISPARAFTIGLVVRRCQHVSGTQFASIWLIAPQLQTLCLDGPNVFLAAFWKYSSSDRFEVLH